MNPIFQKRTFRTLNLKRRSSKPSFSLVSIALLFVIGGLLLSGCNLFSSANPGEGEVTQTQPPVDNPPTPEPAAGIPLPTSGGETPPESASPTEVAETFPDPSSYQWELFAEGLDSPLFLTHAGDGSNRIFVVEKPGRILIFENRTRLPEPFLDITGIVNSRSFERGLLGLAFHPNFADNGMFFINFTNSGGNTVVARYQVSEDRNRADPGSAEILLTVRQPFNNHNGGMIAFGPDGYLYIGMGDGGSANDPDENAQNPETLLGKILRIDVDGGDPYGIPAGNAANGLPEIWALGLRNPWRFSFDRATNDLFIGDVGQNQWEEIHYLPAGTQGGTNLGWDYFEGSHNFEGDPPVGTSFVSPIAEYSHSGTHCSVTGGYVYRGAQLPAWQGIYLYGDYCSGYVWGALPGADGSWQTTQLFQMPAQISSFGEDESGEVYLVDLLGSIYQLAIK
jgi:glucose/arabinose dehydrogenase